MGRGAGEIQARARQLAPRVVCLVGALSGAASGREVGRQLLRSATSVSANCRAARRARARREFIAELGFVADESADTQHRLDRIVPAGLKSEDKAGPLREEAKELTKVFAAMRRSAVNRARHPNRQITGSPDRRIDHPETEQIAP
ncbi:MAG: four helix bundle protein [Leptolyngbya sp. PLA3]|nr:four helix bundle protein [Leptolyngbya sp. PL-A3]